MISIAEIFANHPPGAQHDAEFQCADCHQYHWQGFSTPVLQTIVSTAVTVK